jgi:hypothetical protein
MRAAVAIIIAFGKRRLELKRQLARASRQRALRRRRRALGHSRRTDRSPSRRYVEGDPDRTRRRFSGAGHGEIEAQGADPRPACRRHEDDNNGAAERLAGARPGCTAFAAKTARPLRQATNPNSRQPIIWPSGPSSSAMKERAAIAADPAGCSDRSKPISSDGLPPGRIGSTQISSARRLHGEPGFSRRAIECHVSADWPPVTPAVRSATIETMIRASVVSRSSCGSPSQHHCITARAPLRGVLRSSPHERRRSFVQDRCPARGVLLCARRLRRGWRAVRQSVDTKKSLGT